MFDSFADVHFSIDASAFQFSVENEVLTCLLTSCNDLSTIGFVTITYSKKVRQPLKRKQSMAIVSGKSPKQVAGRKDVQSALEDLNLMPQIGNDLGCSLCSYVATRRDHLKTHYKLKHLGGAGMSISCNLCQKVCSTKSNLKSHMMSKHGLTREDSTKLIS